jgi:hypothetical protein
MIVENFVNNVRTKSRTILDVIISFSMVARVFLLNIKKRGKAETFATKLACCSTTAVPWTMARPWT